MLMKVLLFLSKGFEHMEAAPFIDVMGWAKHDFVPELAVETYGFGREVISAFGVPIVVDRLLEEANAGDYDALAIPGGFGDKGFWSEAWNEKFLALIREFDEQKKPIAAVCVASLALGKSGILNGRRATTYHLEGGRRLRELKNLGARVLDERIVLDGNIITSQSPETAVDVAFELLKMLTSKEIAKQVREKMGYK